MQYVGTNYRWSEETRDVLHKILNLCEAQIEQGVWAQQTDESFEQFLTELKLLVKDCGYADPHEMVRHRVVIGCYSSKGREKLVHEGSDLTQEKAIDIA